MKVVRTFWWRRRPIGNFGDELTPLILERLFNVTAEWSDEPGKLLAVGTILGYAKSGDQVWGSGSGGQPPSAKNLTVHAVRGPLTRNLLIQAGIQCPEVYGDPAVLLPKIFPGSTSQAGIGLVPHHNELDAVTRRLGDRKSFRIISPLLEPMEFVAQLTSCKVVLSSSLHGLITADAYEIPSRFVRFVVRSQATYTSELKGRFKFDDYCLGAGKEPSAPNFILHECDVTRLAASARFAPVRLDFGRLSDSFPLSCRTPPF